MENFDQIEQLCRLYTNLDEEDIRVICQVAAGLPALTPSGAAGVDYFIDCPCVNPSEIVVVARAFTGASLYEFSTVGYIIQEDAEPAAFRSLRLGIKTEEMRAVTMASTQQHLVVQNVRPILRGGRTIGVLIMETPYYSDPQWRSTHLSQVLQEEDLRQFPFCGTWAGSRPA